MYGLASLASHHNTDGKASVDGSGTAHEQHVGATVDRVFLERQTYLNYHATAVGGNPVHFFRTIVGNFVRRCDNLTVERVYDNSLNGNF